jgi:hypothetical protein
MSAFFLFLIFLVECQKQPKTTPSPAALIGGSKTPHMAENRRNAHFFPPLCMFLALFGIETRCFGTPIARNSKNSRRRLAFTLELSPLVLTRNFSP